MPRKGGGVFLMLLVFIMLALLPLGGGKANVLKTVRLCFVFFDFMLLFWLGGLPVIFPFDLVGMVCVTSFFFAFLGLF